MSEILLPDVSSESVVVVAASVVVAIIELSSSLVMTKIEANDQTKWLN